MEVGAGLLGGTGGGERDPARRPSGHRAGEGLEQRRRCLLPFSRQDRRCQRGQTFFSFCLSIPSGLLPIFGCSYLDRTDELECFLFYFASSFFTSDSVTGSIFDPALDMNGEENNPMN
jgi:hypothetical protein